MSKPQIIRDRAGKAAFVVLPIEEYEALKAAREDAEDLAILAAVEGEEHVPYEVAERILSGEHPLRVWRQHRGLTLARLAEKAGLTHGYISEIESGKKDGSLRALRALARALDLDLDDIVPDVRV